MCPCFPSPLLSAELRAMWGSFNIKASTTHLLPSTTLTSEAALHLAGRSSTGDSPASSTPISLPRLKGEQHSNAVGLMAPKAPGPPTSLGRSKAKSWCVGCCRGETSGVRLWLEKSEFQPVTTWCCRMVPKVSKALLSEWSLGTRGSRACYFGTCSLHTAHLGAFPYSSPNSPCYCRPIFRHAYIQKDLVFINWPFIGNSTSCPPPRGASNIPAPGSPYMVTIS